MKLTYEKGSWNNSTSPKILAANEISDNGRLLARYYTISPSGFILVPILKEMQPVKAYSAASHLDIQQNQGFIRLMEETLSERMNNYESAYGSLDASQPISGEVLFDRKQRTLWDIYTLPSEQFRNKVLRDYRNVVEGGPLLTSNWHQGPPYWNDCPIDGNGKCLVGCLATAMAQILYYWRWPDYGYGNYSYTWYNDFYCGYTVPPQVISADFSDEYDWDNMPDDCASGCTSIQQEALAELNYEVGISLQSIYGSCITAAEICPWSYITYFKYSSDITVEHRIHYANSEWFALIREEVDNNRPMQYVITDHSIVCDGYRDDGNGLLEYHMNYGWGDSFNAWYVLDEVGCPWCSGGTNPYEQEYMVTHIEPETKPFVNLKEFELLESIGDGDGYADAGETLSLTVTLENMGTNAYNTQGELSSDDPYITGISTSTSVFDAVLSHGDLSTNTDPFIFSIHVNCPDPHIATLEFSAISDGGYTKVDTIYIFIGNTTGFTNDFESGQYLWNHRPIALGAYDEWHTESSRTHSGTLSWKAGGSGLDSYSCVQDAGLITPPFLLPDHAKMTFWDWMDSEIGGSPDIAWDGGVVMLSANGSSWTQITPEGGYPCSIVEFSGIPIGANTPCFSGGHDWKQEIFDLSEYSGIVQIMFRFGADAATVREGWYIDDIAVTRNYICGDANGDDDINILDIVYLINYKYKSGQAPIQFGIADVNSDASIDILDIVYLINYKYKSGPLPHCAE